MQSNVKKNSRTKAPLDNAILNGSTPLTSLPARTRKASDKGYRVRVNPLMDGDGRLEEVRFTADYGAKVHLEWTVQAGLIDASLRTIESSAVRYLVLDQLRFGMRVELPGTYTPPQLLGLGLRNVQ